MTSLEKYKRSWHIREPVKFQPLSPKQLAAKKDRIEALVNLADASDRCYKAGIQFDYLVDLMYASTARSHLVKEISKPLAEADEKVSEVIKRFS